MSTIAMKTTSIEFAHTDGATVRAERSDRDPSVWAIRVPSELPRDVFGHRPYVQVISGADNARLAQAAHRILDALVAYQTVLRDAEEALAAVLNDLHDPGALA